jgi:hypothetical protein
VFWALIPIVAPADDYIATGGGVAVVAETPALKFKFDEDTLASRRTNPPFCFAIWETVANRFDDVA